MSDVPKDDGHRQTWHIERDDEVEPLTMTAMFEDFAGGEGESNAVLFFDQYNTLEEEDVSVFFQARSIPLLMEHLAEAYQRYLRILNLLGTRLPTIENPYVSRDMADQDDLEANR